jgi:hypothetical protein
VRDSCGPSDAGHWLYPGECEHDPPGRSLLALALQCHRFVSIFIRQAMWNPFDFDVVVIMLAMLYIMFRKYRDLKTSSLVSIIYRDGLVYFVCLSGECL